MSEPVAPEIFALEIIVPNSLGDLNGTAWFNGVYMQWRDIKLHPMAHSLHYASGYFDGVRVYKGEPFRLTEHVIRFKEAARALSRNSKPLSYSQEELEEAFRRVVKERNITKGYIRPIAWRGAGPADFDATPNPWNVAVFAFPLEIFISNGAKLLLSEERRPVPGPMELWKIKAAGNYMPSTLQKQRAKQLDHNDVLFLDHEGYVADTTGANLFVVANDKLHIPKSNGFFLGITHETVISLAKEAGLEMTERPIPVADLSHVDEVFMAGSAAGIVSVAQITLDSASKIVYAPTPPVTIMLQKKYIELAGGN